MRFKIKVKPKQEIDLIKSRLKDAEFLHKTKIQEISVKPKSKNRKHAHLSVVSSGEKASFPLAGKKRVD